MWCKHSNPHICLLEKGQQCMRYHLGYSPSRSIQCCGRGAWVREVRTVYWMVKTRSDFVTVSSMKCQAYLGTEPMILNILRINEWLLLRNRGPSYSAYILDITIYKTKLNKPTFLQLITENMSNQLPERCSLDERIAFLNSRSPCVNIWSKTKHA